MIRSEGCQASLRHQLRADDGILDRRRIALGVIPARWLASRLEGSEWNT
jgi:hypothetical protein